MINTNSRLAVEQIYNFVAELDGFDAKSRFMQFSIFLSELHEGDKSEFKAFRPISFHGRFNNIVKSISTSTAPEFSDKSRFLDWVVDQIN